MALYRRGAILLALAWAMSVATIGIARAQEATPAARNLRDYLKYVVYDPAERGPLMVVAPPEKFTVERPLAPPGVGRISLAPLTAAFGRQIMTAGRITILAPRTMTLINTDLGKPAPLQDLSKDDALLLLFASFTAEQWEQLRGTGLSAADVTPEQRPLFHTFLPAMKARLSRLTRTDDDKYDLLDSDGEAVELDAAKIRIRLVNRLSVVFKSARSPNQQYALSDQHGIKRGETVWIKEFDSFDQDNDPKTRRAFGKDLFPVVPNELKPGEIYYAAPALNRPLSLSSDDKTVGDLLHRVGEAMHLELLADKRVALLPVYWRTTPQQSVRAGDILEALARSVAGAFRKEGPQTYLLTNDIEGIGTRRERQEEWLAASQTAREKYRQRAWARIREKKPLSPVSLDTRGTLSLTPEMQKKWDDFRPQLPGDRLSLPLKSLPAPWRQELAYRALSEDDPVAIDAERDTLLVSAEPQLIFTAPDDRPISEVNNELRFAFLFDQLKSMTAENAAPSASPTEQKPEPVTLDLSWKRRILWIAPKTPENATDAVTEAKSRGFSEIWIHQTRGKTDADNLAPLKAAIAAGKNAGVKVVVETPLLRETGLVADDFNILGETPTQFVSRHIAEQEQAGESGDSLRGTRYSYQQWDGWIAPTEKTRAEIVERIAKIAAVPGLAGMAFSAVSPPGYVTDSTYLNADIFPYEYGYLPEWRLAFLRQEGFDPVDLTRSRQRSYSLPFFSESVVEDNTKLNADQRLIPEPDGPSALTKWRLFREKRSFALLRDVFKAARAAQPDLPLYQSDRMSEVTQSAPFFDSLETPDKIVRPSYFDRNPQETALRVRRVVGVASGEPLSGIPPDGFFSFFTSEKARNNQGWAGVVIDMTEIAFPRVPSLLRTLEPAKK